MKSIAFVLLVAAVVGQNTPSPETMKLRDAAGRVRLVLGDCAEFDEISGNGDSFGLAVLDKEGRPKVFIGAGEETADPTIRLISDPDGPFLTLWSSRSGSRMLISGERRGEQGNVLQLSARAASADILLSDVGPLGTPTEVGRARVSIGINDSGAAVLLSSRDGLRTEVSEIEE